jgi:hypothetical protein
MDFNLAILRDPPSYDFRCYECNGKFHPIYDIVRLIGFSNSIIWYIIALSGQLGSCICDHCYNRAKRQNICFICSDTKTCARCGNYINKIDRSKNICPKCSLVNPLILRI